MSEFNVNFPKIFATRIRNMKPDPYYCLQPTELATPPPFIKLNKSFSFSSAWVTFFGGK